jgi:hypothetical protein
MVEHICKVFKHKVRPLAITRASRSPPHYHSYSAAIKTADLGGKVILIPPDKVADLANSV